MRSIDGSFDLMVGWLIDGTGAPARRNVRIRVDNGVIASLAHTRHPEREGGEAGTIVNFSSCTLLPGMVDCHIHLTMSGTEDERMRRKQLGYSFEHAVPLMEERIKKHLFYGIMALRDGGDAAAHAGRFKTGRFPSLGFPLHLKVSGRAWRAKGRYGRLIGRPPEDGLTLGHCIGRQDEDTDHVKIIQSGLNSLTEFGKETTPQFSLEELLPAVEAGRARGWKTMVHANGKLPVQLALDARCDSIEHGFFMGRDNMRRMADLQIFWVPTAFSMKAFSSWFPPESIEAQGAARNLDHQLEQIAQAREMGVPVVVGTDAGGFGIYHGKSFIEELRLFRTAGFSVEEAVRCASLEGARLLGIQDQIGQIKRGMEASFVIVDGPPSAFPQSLGSARKVYVRGVPVFG